MLLLSLLQWPWQGMYVQKLRHGLHANEEDVAEAQLVEAPEVQVQELDLTAQQDQTQIQQHQTRQAH